VRKAAARRAPLSRKEQGEQTRQAILEAAAELYAESGFRGTGLMAIGERAGVHHATVLYHFRSSRELLLAVLEERDRRFVALSGDVLRDGGLAALRKLPTIARLNARYKVWAKLFAVLQVENLDPGAEAHDYFVARRRGARQLTIELLRTAKQRGEIRQDVDEIATTDTILAFMGGINTQSFLDPKQVDVAAVYERFTAMLVHDLTRGLRRS
jgi:AcrR family transcriptional regulator